MSSAPLIYTPLDILAREKETPVPGFVLPDVEETWVHYCTTTLHLARYSVFRTGYTELHPITHEKTRVQGKPLSVVHADMLDFIRQRHMHKPMHRPDIMDSALLTEHLTKGERHALRRLAHQTLPDIHPLPHALPLTEAADRAQTSFDLRNILDLQNEARAALPVSERGAVASMNTPPEALVCYLTYEAARAVCDTFRVSRSVRKALRRFCREQHRDILHSSTMFPIKGTTTVYAYLRRPTEDEESEARRARMREGKQHLADMEQDAIRRAAARATARKRKRRCKRRYTATAIGERSQQ